jgi:methylsterol monooxygenase
MILYIIPYFVIKTVYLFYLLNLFGTIVSYITLRSSIWDKLLIQNKRTYSYYSNRFIRIFVNAFIFEPGLAVIGLTSIKFIFADNFNVLTTIFQLLILLLIDDLWLYWTHRLLHYNKFLFRKVHKIHHLAATPFCMDMHYFHPIEMIVIPIGTFLGFFLLYMYWGYVQIYTLYIYTLVRTLHEQNVHSGIKQIIKLPKSISGYIGGTMEHDLHHSKIRGNYASMFKIWDRLCGTELDNKTYYKENYIGNS